MSYKCEYCKETCHKKSQGGQCPNCGGKLTKINTRLPWWKDDAVMGKRLLESFLIFIFVLVGYGIYWSTHYKVIVIRTTTCEVLPCEVPVMIDGKAWVFTWVSTDTGHYEMGEWYHIGLGELK